jgi:hypothetical protein
MSKGPYYPPGPYRAVVIQQAMSEAKTGTPQFVLRFRVLESLSPAVPEVEQFERTMYLPITDGTISFFFEKLQRLGFYGQSFKQLDPEEEGHHSFIDQEVEVYCKHDSYNGVVSEKWDVSKGAGEFTPINPKSLRDLDNKYGKQLKSMFGKSPQPLDAANRQVEKEFEAEEERLAKQIDTALEERREAANTALATATADMEIPF